MARPRYGRTERDGHAGIHRLESTLTLDKGECCSLRYRIVLCQRNFSEWLML